MNPIQITDADGKTRPMRILLTGAGGGVATMLRPPLSASGSTIRLSDIKPPDLLAANETFVLAQLTDPEQVKHAVAGMDAVIHLGGFSVEGPWDAILQSNIIGCWNLFEAAQRAGVKRVVFASSNHAVGFYPRTDVIDAERKVRPDSRYGISKAFGEATAAYYADKFGLRVTSLRIGNVGYKPLDRRRLSIWLHPEDLLQLIRIGLEHPSIHCEILYGASDNARTWWDNSRATELGYKPQHRSEDFAAQILATIETADPIGDRYQGGAFCSQDAPISFRPWEL